MKSAALRRFCIFVITAAVSTVPCQYFIRNQYIRVSQMYKRPHVCKSSPSAGYWFRKVRMFNDVMTLDMMQLLDNKCWWTCNYCTCTLPGPKTLSWWRSLGLITACWSSIIYHTFIFTCKRQQYLSEEICWSHKWKHFDESVNHRVAEISLLAQNEVIRARRSMFSLDTHSNRQILQPE